MTLVKKRRIQVALVLGVILLFALYASITALRKPPLAEKEALPVRTINAELATSAQTIKLTGFISNDNTVTIFPKVAGTLLSLTTQTGEIVSKDEVLATIDDKPYEYQLSRAEAAYSATKATWERVENLYKMDSLAKQTYDTAKAEFEAAQSQYNLAKLQFDYTKIRAPVNGTVLKVHTEQGNSVVQTLPLVTIGSTDSLKITLDIPERYFLLFNQPSVYEAGAISVEIPILNNQKLSASLQTVAPYISPQTRTFEIECSVVADSRVYAGMLARVFIIADQVKNAYTLPFAALIGGNTLWYVESNMHDSKKSIAKKITLDPEFIGDTTFVIPQKYASYQFIYEGQHFLQENDSVIVLEN